jgi:hypothetical protein
MNQTVLDMIFPQANAAASGAANAALDTAAARPFNVIITIDDQTKIWFSVMLAVTIIAWRAKR